MVLTGYEATALWFFAQHLEYSKQHSERLLRYLEGDALAVAQHMLGIKISQTAKIEYTARCLMQMADDQRK